jgi:hypothetical protein
VRSAATAPAAHPGYPRASAHSADLRGFEWERSRCFALRMVHWSDDSG